MVAFRRKLAFCDISDCILSSLPKVDFIQSVSCLGGVAYSIILGRWPFTFTFTLLGFQRIEIWLLLLQNSNYQTFKFESLIKAYSSGRQCQYVFIIDDRQPLSSCPSLSNSWCFPSCSPVDHTVVWCRCNAMVCNGSGSSAKQHNWAEQSKPLPPVNAIAEPLHGLTIKFDIWMEYDSL